MDVHTSMRQLGQTGIKVTPIGLGVMEFSGKGGPMGFTMPDLPQTEMNAIVRAALDGGINWFDTAEMYGGGRSEHNVATALKTAGKADGDVIIETKWWPLFRTADSIRRTIDDRLRALDGFGVDVHLVHQPFSFSSPEDEMNAMADLVEAGKIRAVGVSNFSPERMRRAHTALAKRGIPLAVNQVHYSLLHRDIEANGVLDTAQALGVTIVAWYPLGSGILTGKYHRDPDLRRSAPYVRRMMLRGRMRRSTPLVQLLGEIGAARGATPAQVALSWLITFRGESVVAIPGASKAAHAADNAAAMRLRLTEEDMVRLDRASREFVR